MHQTSSGKHDLSSKQWGKIYQCCVGLGLLYCCETQDLTVADEVRMCGIEHHLIMMCVGRLIARLLTDVLQDRVGATVKTKDMIIKSVCSDMVMSSVETSTFKYVRIQSLK